MPGHRSFGITTSCLSGQGVSIRQLPTVFVTLYSVTIYAIGMLPTEVLLDFARRPVAAILSVRSQLTPELLAAHPGGHDNSIGWLLWHMGREIDVQLSALSGLPEVWTSQGFGKRLGLGELGDGVGYGQTRDEARRIVVTDPQALVDYAIAASEALSGYLSTLDPETLADVVDEGWDPPVTRATRLVSIVDDAAQHAGQVGYALGILAGDDV